MQAEPLRVDAYRAFGDVVGARDDIAPVSANLGSARRYNAVAKLSNLRAGAAPNLCVFRSEPLLTAGADRFVINLLERHRHSTQVFVPMSGVERYLVIVCEGGDQPDLSTLRAFIATGAQGVSYAPGVWHHPLVAMHRAGDFACLVWEDGSDDDCETVSLAAPPTVVIPAALLR